MAAALVSLAGRRSPQLALETEGVRQGETQQDSAQQTEIACSIGPSIPGPFSP
jgi:hypothetical protein